MADNVAITAGSGTTVSTDELTINAVAVQVQRVKHALGKDGTYVGDQSGRLIDGDASAAAAATDPRLLVARLVVTPSVSSGAIYALKDAVGGLLTFTNAVRASGGTCRLETVVVVDKGQQMKDLDLVLFNATFGAPSDNAVFAPSDAELLTCIGVVRITAGDYADFSTNSVAVVTNIGLELVLAGTSLFGALVARGTPTYTSTSDIQVALTVTQE